MGWIKCVSAQKLRGLTHLLDVILVSDLHVYLQIQKSSEEETKSHFNLLKPFGHILH